MVGMTFIAGGIVITAIIVTVAFCAVLPEGLTRLLLWRVAGKKQHALMCRKYGRCYGGCSLCFDVIQWWVFGDDRGLQEERVKKWLPLKKRRRTA